MLTTFDLDEHVYDALAAGASGFLLKDLTAERLFDAVRVIASGGGLLAPSVTRRLIAEFARQRPHSPAKTIALGNLTPREVEVLALIAQGLSNLEIATRLTVSVETVKTRVSRLLAKLRLRDRTQAVSPPTNPASSPPAVRAPDSRSSGKGRSAIAPSRPRTANRQ
jgi:DNA-binding NarL/FixJ family response regulator